MVATKQIYSALQLTGLMVQACEPRYCPFPEHGVTCQTSYTLKDLNAHNCDRYAMPLKGIRTVHGIVGLTNCDLESGLEHIDFIIDPNYAELQCKDWTIKFHLSSNDLPQISAYNQLYVPTLTFMGPFHAIGHSKNYLWRMEGTVTFNGSEIKKCVVRFDILSKGLGVPKHYAHLIKNPETSQNQEEDSLTNQFAFETEFVMGNKISRHAVPWLDIETIETDILEWRIGLDMMGSMHLVLSKYENGDKKSVYKIGF